jgi:hypothetical protein
MGNHGKSMEIPHEWAFNGIYINEKHILDNAIQGSHLRQAAIQGQHPT